MDYAMKNILENQIYLWGPELGWFMWDCSPLMQSIDLALLTCSPRLMSAPARGLISLISVMEGVKSFRLGKDGGKEARMFVQVDDDQSYSLTVYFFAL